jgi:hypothetical protein
MGENGTRHEKDSCVSFLQTGNLRRYFIVPISRKDHGIPSVLREVVMILILNKYRECAEYNLKMRTG